MSYGLFFYADLSFPNGTASWLAHRVAPEDFDWSNGAEEPFFDTGFPANTVSKILKHWRNRELGVEVLAVCAAALGHGGTGRAAFVQDVGDFGYSLKVGKRSLFFDALTPRQARRALENEQVDETVKIGLAQAPRAKKKRRLSADP